MRHYLKHILSLLYGRAANDMAVNDYGQMQGRCALCTTSNEDDPNARSYAVTYKMLAEYSAAERTRILEDLRFVCVPELDPAQVKEMLDCSTKREEVVNLHAKASALFALLGTLCVRGGVDFGTRGR